MHPNRHRKNVCGGAAVEMEMSDGLREPVTGALPKAAVVRFKLKNGEGGVLIDPDGRESARWELTRRYGGPNREDYPMSMRILLTDVLTMSTGIFRKK